MFMPLCVQLQPSSGKEDKEGDPAIDMPDRLLVELPLYNIHLS